MKSNRKAANLAISFSALIGFNFASSLVMMPAMAESSSTADGAAVRNNAVVDVKTTPTATGTVGTSTGGTTKAGEPPALPGSAAAQSAAAGVSGTTQEASNAAPVETPSASIPKTKWRPGEELTITTNAEDLVPTDDATLAAKQVTAFPDSPEAAFINAVALTRTSRVEEALKEVRRARKLAEAKGGNAYFDKMITSYEDMLKIYPNENRVRYGLAWAYYMKAYLLANYSRKVAAWKAVNGDPAAAAAKQAATGTAATPASGAKVDTTAGASVGSTSGTGNVVAIASATGASPADLAKAQAALKTAAQPGGKGLDLNAIMGAVGGLAQGNAASLPKIPSVMDKVDPADVPQIKKFYEMALAKLDELIAQKPDDVWAIVYRAHLRAEYNGNLDQAMTTWLSCREKFPNNPAAYFFLGEGYLKQGNLKESLNNVSRAVALRAMGY